MFALKVFVTLMLVAATFACPDENCSQKSAGKRSEKQKMASIVLEDGACFGTVDLKLVPGCRVVGAQTLDVCDNDSKPLVVIADDLSKVDVQRNGRCRDEVYVDVMVQCEQPLRRNQQAARPIIVKTARI